MTAPALGDGFPAFRPIVRSVPCFGWMHCTGLLVTDRPNKTMMAGQFAPNQILFGLRFVLGVEIASDAWRFDHRMILDGERT